MIVTGGSADLRDTESQAARFIFNPKKFIIIVNE